MKANLTDVPETTLWTLHNRAGEAMRPKKALIKDDKCIEIYQAIDYDYERSFGKASPAHALRSVHFDRHLEEFLRRHPEGTIVNLGEGLETQRFRIDNGKAFWITVDLPESIEIREKFIEPSPRHLHVALSATDRRWFDLVPEDKPVFITAQGLFMYFAEQAVAELVRDIVERLPAGYLMFDTIPAYFSRKTMSEKGFHVTKHYVAPKMPWGINRNQIVPTVSVWSDRIKQVEVRDYLMLWRGLYISFFAFLMKIGVLKNIAPTTAKVTW
ncbi:MAG: class I SAM-dependent methyltransferase [Bacteroidota bacterium]